MAKYPGSFIINEVGTRKELAGLYGVSERTIYRWLAKAAKESGITPRPKKSMPAPRALASFKGTRKQLAAKYGVSERTAYRWLAKTRSSSEIPAGSVNRAKTSKYPGTNILNIPGKNKDLADQFGVSERTISRWRRRARLEEAGANFPDRRKTGQYKRTRVNIGDGKYIYDWQYVGDETVFEQQNEEAYRPENLIEPPEVEEPEPVYEEPIEGTGPKEESGPWEVPDYDWYEDDRPEWDKLGMREDIYENLQEIIKIITENELLTPNSVFNNLEGYKTIQYMDEYIKYQYDLDPSQFYDPETHEFKFDSEWVSALPIWRDEFEQWLTTQIEIDKYEI